jgi:uncharacterized membrane protein YfcA
MFEFNSGKTFITLVPLMQSEFLTYLKLGIGHILDIQAYDHILFVIVLCSKYIIEEYKKILLLVTAFTIGHSFTLALAALNIVYIPSDIIEFLIPVTIFITAIYNIFTSHKTEKRDWKQRSMQLNYFFALFFGLIHGVGFSNFFRSLLGLEESIIKPLFSFNLGIELGQIAVVFCLLLLSFLFIYALKVKRLYWTIFWSVISGVIAVILMRETIFW